MKIEQYARDAKRGGNQVPQVHFVFPDGTRRTVDGPWVFDAFKDGVTKITDEDDGTRYVVVKTDAGTCEVTLGKIAKTVLAFGGEEIEFK